MGDCLNITLLSWVAAVSLPLVLSQEAIVLHSCVIKTEPAQRIKLTMELIILCKNRKQ